MRGVLFDLGGVVLNSPFSAIEHLEGELSLERGTINRVIGRSGNNGAFARLERGELTSRSFAIPFAEDCKRAGLAKPIDGSLLIRKIAAACTPRPLMVDALKVLKEAPGLKTAAVTNNFLMDDKADNFATAEIACLSLTTSSSLHGAACAAPHRGRCGATRPPWTVAARGIPLGWEGSKVPERGRHATRKVPPPPSP